MRRMAEHERIELQQLAQLGRDELVRQARAGELSRGRLWTALKGGARYLGSIVLAHCADETEQRRRMACCLLCSSRKDRAVPELGVTACYCGEPFADRMDAEKPTCGCLIGAIGLADHACLPGGKLIVAGESCPQGRWGAQR